MKASLFSKENKKFQSFLFVASSICLLASWVSLLSRTSLWWNEASYYTHGWAVPLLALVLILNRFGERTGNHHFSLNSWTPIVLGTFLFLPARMLAEPDPFWRIPLWVEMAAICWITGLFIRHTKLKISSQSWSVISLYLLTALPWPAGMETKVVYELTQIVSSLTAESLLLLGFPAVLSQGAILVDEEMVKINQACSGIRSLQNLISLAIFLSVYFRLSWGKFIFIIIMAGLVTLVFNFLRALSLSYLSLEFGTDIQDQWHDIVGNSYVTLSMLALGTIGWLLRERLAGEEMASKLLDNGKFLPPKTTLSLSFLYAFSIPQLFAISWFYLLCPKPEKFTWSVDLGESTQQIAQGIKDVLQFDYGEKKKFSTGPDAWIEAIHFGYNPESAAASLCSRNHPPDYCMGYTGVKILESNSEVTYDYEGSSLVFRHYFSKPDQMNGDPGLNVFWGSFALDSRIASFEFKNSSILEKSKWFLSGKLSYERKVLLVTVKGSKNQQHAKDELFSLLGKILAKSNT